MNVKFLNCKDDDFKFVKEIRKAVFTEEQGIPVSEDLDSLDNDINTVYCLVFDGEPSATGRLIKNENGYKIGRIATRKEKRGKGLGMVLVKALCEKAFALGADCVHLEAQLHAVPFYQKLGFEIVSHDVIIDRGIEHLEMRKTYG